MYEYDFPTQWLICYECRWEGWDKDVRHLPDGGYKCPFCGCTSNIFPDVVLDKPNHDNLASTVDGGNV